MTLVPRLAVLCLLPLTLGLCLIGGCVTEPPPGAAARSDEVVRRAPSGEGAQADLTTASDESETRRRARIRLELASAYFGQGQTTTALDEVKRSLAADADYAPAYNLRGLIYAAMGEAVLADESFVRALSLAPRDADTLHNYGWFLCRQKRYASARSHFEAALAVPRYRDAAKTLLASGICEARAGDYAAAERQLLRSYELDAGNPATAVNLAEVLLRRNDLERARFYIERVNRVPELANAQTAWLALRIERRRGNAAAVEEWGRLLRTRYPDARETAAYEQGKFDE